MDTITILDDILLFLNQDARFHAIEHIEKFIKEKNKDILPNDVIRSIRKLIKDGYVETDIYEDHMFGHIRKTTLYGVSLEGRLFFENASLIWKNKPYSWKRTTGIINAAYITAKTIMVALSTLVIIWISYLTYKAQNKINDLEKETKQLQKENDSLKTQKKKPNAVHKFSN